jgi:coenzyme F420-reducing hydrogenase gamma subunit
VEGAITTSTEAEQLKDIRKNAGHVVALGTCACNGGIPAMRNFVESRSLRKYVYHHRKHPDVIPASGIGEFIEVDYFMRGCPIIKNEFVMFLSLYLKGIQTGPFEGSV